MYYFVTEFIPQHIVYLLQGAVVTLELCFVSMVVSVAIGLFCAIIVTTGRKIPTALVRIYVNICRGVPLIVLLLFVYFTLPEIGIRLPAFWAGVVG